jgi:hypothetical protein
MDKLWSFRVVASKETMEAARTAIIEHSARLYGDVFRASGRERADVAIDQFRLALEAIEAAMKEAV